MEVRCVPCGSTGGAATRMVYHRIQESKRDGIPFKDSPENSEDASPNHPCMAYIYPNDFR